MPGDPVSVLHSAFLEGSAMTNHQLEALCNLLGLDRPEGKTKNDLLKLIIDSIFTDDLLRQKAVDACSKPKAAKPAVADDDVTRAVVESLADDPDNTDAVKEAKKTYAKKRIKELEIVIKAKAQPKAKSRAAKAKAKEKAKSSAKAKAWHCPVQGKEWLQQESPSAPIQVDSHRHMGHTLPLQLHLIL